MSPSPRAILLLVGLLAVLGCGRDQETGGGARTPIVETRLRTPKGSTRVGQALSAHTPMPDTGDELIVRDAPPAPAAAKSPPPEAAKPTPVKPSPTAEQKSAPPPAEPTPIRLARRAVVPRGVELASAPSGQVLGEFQGRTDIEVLEKTARAGRVSARK